MNFPLISVVIPAYNAAKYIKESIESVLQQDYSNLEIILVDDGSTDETAKIVQQYDVQYIYQENKGVSAARNTGLQAANGIFIASIDADDLWLPNKLSIQFKVFQEQPALDMVFCQIKQFICPVAKQDGMSLYIPEGNKILPGYTPVTMLIKKQAFQKVGKFNEDFKFGDFLEWYGRVKESNLKETVINEVLALRRIHKSNMGMNQLAARKDYLKILKARLNRQRQTSKG